MSHWKIVISSVHFYRCTEYTVRIEGSLLLLSGTATRSKVSSSEPAKYTSLFRARGTPRGKSIRGETLPRWKTFFRRETRRFAPGGRSFCSIERPLQGRLALASALVSPIIKRLIKRPRLRLHRRVVRWIMRSSSSWGNSRPFNALSFSKLQNYLVVSDIGSRKYLDSHSAVSIFFNF